MGLSIGTRMTVLRFGDDLLLHSPVAATDELRKAVTALGRVRWVVAPNRFHHLYCADWLGPNIELLGAPGLQKKRRDLEFNGTIGNDATLPPGLRALVFTAVPAVSESVYLHEASRSLIVSDLIFNLPAEAPWWTRTAMRMMGGYPGPRTTLIERILAKRAMASEQISAILGWDFDRIVLAHGDIIDDDATGHLRRAWSWALPNALKVD